MRGAEEQGARQERVLRPDELRHDGHVEDEDRRVEQVGQDSPHNPGRGDRSHFGGRVGNGTCHRFRSHLFRRERQPQSAQPEVAEVGRACEPDRVKGRRPLVEQHRQPERRRHGQRGVGDANSQDGQQRGLPPFGERRLDDHGESRAWRDDQQGRQRREREVPGVEHQGFLSRAAPSCSNPSSTRPRSPAIVRGFISVARSTRLPPRTVLVIQPSPSRL